jgi:hypothetical protein
MSTDIAHAIPLDEAPWEWYGRASNAPEAFAYFWKRVLFSFVDVHDPT